MDLQFRLGVREGYCTSTTPVSMSRSRRGQQGTRGQPVANGAVPRVRLHLVAKDSFHDTSDDGDGVGRGRERLC